MAEAGASKTVRARAREQLVAEITTMARTHLADKGAEHLSLRAVARDLGMVSSALYRYFPSRDALLTQLILDAYNALGDACELGVGGCERSDFAGRFRTLAHAIRDWSVANPHVFALIYGTPVLGFAAPDDTIGPATRVPILLLSVLADIEEAGFAHGAMPANLPAVAPGLAGQLAAITELAGAPIDHQRLLAGLGAWGQIMGLISFELFGTFNNTFEDLSALFAHQVETLATQLALTPAP